MLFYTVAPVDAVSTQAEVEGRLRLEGGNPQSFRGGTFQLPRMECVLVPSEDG
jgi:hypothetical protein